MSDITGFGATFALSAVSGGATPPSSVGRITEISPLVLGSESLDNNDLSNLFAKKRPGDRDTMEDVDLSGVFDPDVHLDIMFNHRKIRFLGTYSYPLQDGETTPHSVSGSGYLSIGESGSLAVGEITSSSLKFVWDGEIVPTHTAST